MAAVGVTGVGMGPGVTGASLDATAVRRADGSIDIDFYADRARRLRGARIREALAAVAVAARRWRRPEIRPSLPPRLKPSPGGRR